MTKQILRLMVRAGVCAHSSSLFLVIEQTDGWLLRFDNEAKQYASLDKLMSTLGGVVQSWEWWSDDAKALIEGVKMRHHFNP